MRKPVVGLLLLAGAVLAPSSTSATSSTEAGAPLATVPFELSSGYIVFPVSLGRSETSSFLFDTGCQTTVVSEKVLRDRSGGSKLLLNLGSFELAHMPVLISTSDKGLFAVTKYDGIVGTTLLRRFNVILDYRRNRLRVEPLSHGSAP